MIDDSKEHPAAQGGAASDSPDQMAQAVESVKANSPELADKIAAAGITPEDLAGAHGQAASDEPAGEGQG